MYNKKNEYIYSIKDYIKDINNYPLLSLDEEQEIGYILHNIKDNKYVILNRYDIPVFNYEKLFGNLSYIDIDSKILTILKDILNNSKNTKIYQILNKYLNIVIEKNSFLSKKELKEYFNINKFKNNDKNKIINELNNYVIYLKSRQKMIESNYRLAFSISKKYFNKKLDPLDLINEANIGLMISVDKYDVTKGYRFSSYAVRTIETYIKRILPKYNVISISEFISKEIYEFNKKRIELENETNKKYSIKELSEIFNIDYEVILSYMIYNTKLVSLDIQISNEDDDLALIDTISYRKNGFKKLIETDFLKKSLNLLLNELNEREREVLLYRYGIINNKIPTYLELSKMYNISYQRVSEIERNAMKKLEKCINKNKDKYRFIKENL